MARAQQFHSVAIVSMLTADSSRLQGGGAWARFFSKCEGGAASLSTRVCPLCAFRCICYECPVDAWGPWGETFCGGPLGLAQAGQSRGCFMHYHEHEILLPFTHFAAIC